MSFVAEEDCRLASVAAGSVEFSSPILAVSVVLTGSVQFTVGMSPAVPAPCVRMKIPFMYVYPLFGSLIAISI